MQIGGALVERPGAVAQRLGLPTDQLATGVLAHLHGVAAHQAPGAPGRIAGHGLGDLAAVARLVAVAHAEGVAHAALVGIAHRRRETPGEEGVELRHHVEAGGLVMPGLGHQGMPADVGPGGGGAHGQDATGCPHPRKIDYS